MLKEGVKKINEQHRKIFDYTTDLFSHCTGDDAEENHYFAATIGAAATLVKTHFKTEEDLMIATKFQFFEYVDHKKEHEEFIATLVDNVKQFRTSGSINLLMFASYAKWWVINHIKRFDKKYVAYFNKITEGRGIEKMRV
ncbi:MAG: hemerythrin domain-containing protein [Treponema sp.]|nr:hemerythrin domain-containing protein [Treponema sp.]